MPTEMTMASKLIADENGRIRLSPTAERIYVKILKPMGKEWRDYDWFRVWHRESTGTIKRMSFNTVAQYLTMMRNRNWIEHKLDIAPETGRQRMYFRIPEALRQPEFYCAGCDKFYPGEARYLCDDCMMVD